MKMLCQKIFVANKSYSLSVDSISKNFVKYLLDNFILNCLYLLMWMYKFILKIFFSNRFRVFVISNDYEWAFSNFWINSCALSNFEKFLQRSFFESHFNHLTKFFILRFVCLSTINFSISKDLTLSKSPFMNTDCDKNWFNAKNKKDSNCAIEITKWIRQCCDIFKRYAKISNFSTIWNKSAYCYDSFFFQYCCWKHIIFFMQF